MLEVENLGLVDGQPVSFGVNRRPALRFRGFGDALRQTRSMSRSYALFGVADFRRAETRMRARMPSEEERRLLLLPPDLPVLVSIGLDVDTEGQPICWSESAFAGDRVEFTLGPESA